MSSTNGFHPNGIRAILFDLDGTLRYNNPPATQFFLDHAVRLGVVDKTEQRRSATRWSHYYWAQSPELLDDLRDFHGSDSRFWINYARRHLIAFACAPEQAAELAPLMHRFMSEAYQAADRLFAAVPETLHSLKQSGYLLGVLSNRDQPCDEYLIALGLDGLFDLALVAGEVEAWKPDPAIFRHALERLGIQPHEALYVGDNYYADVIGARNAGLHPVLFDPEGLFPDAGCPVIWSIDEIPLLLSSQ